MFLLIGCQQTPLFWVDRRGPTTESFGQVPEHDSICYRSQPHHMQEIRTPISCSLSPPPPSRLLLLNTPQSLDLILVYFTQTRGQFRCLFPDFVAHQYTAANLCVCIVLTGDCQQRQGTRSRSVNNCVFKSRTNGLDCGLSRDENIKYVFNRVYDAHSAMPTRPCSQACRLYSHLVNRTYF